MKKTLVIASLYLFLSFNILSQIDFSIYPKISSEEIENYEYNIIFQDDELHIKIVKIDGVTYLVYYWYVL